MMAEPQMVKAVVQAVVVLAVLACMELVALVYNHLYLEHQHIMPAEGAAAFMEVVPLLVRVD
jgi:hypothetical protein